MYAVFEYFKSSMFDTDHYIEHYKDEITWEKEAKEFGREYQECLH